MRYLKNFFSSVDRYWMWLARHPFEVSMMFSVVGLSLCVWAFLIGVAWVPWNGQVGGQTVSGLNVSPKEVGFLLAPNWALAGAILLPCGIGFLCSAAGSTERTIEILFERGMLQKLSDEAISQKAIMEKWRRTSVVWSTISFTAIPIVTAVISVDFYTVVATWLLEPSSAANSIKSNLIAINDPVYEFDWSIAAIMGTANPTALPSAISNLFFSGFAYLHIAILGPAFLLFGFIWTWAFSSFLSQNRLERMGYVLVPDLSDTSDKKRCGFEVFENRFGFLILASIATAIVALAMHLQNVFLRSPEHSNILDMVFGQYVETFRNWEKFEISEFFDLLLTVDEATQLDLTTGANLQFMVTWLVFFLLSMIVAGSSTLWLVVTATSGKARLLASGAISEVQKERLEAMDYWPISWMTARQFVIFISAIMLSMYVVNLLALFLAVALLRLLGGLFGIVRGGK